MYYNILLAWRKRGELISGSLFFLLVLVLFRLSALPLASNPMPSLILLWLTMVFTTLLNLNDFFGEDHKDGSLDIVLLSLGWQDLLLYIYSKLVSHILCNSLPLMLIYPVAGFMLQLSPWAVLTSACTCISSVIGIAALGSLSAAINVVAKPSSFLSFIIILPISCSLSLFALGADQAAIQHQPIGPPLLFLIAIMILFAIIGPLSASVLLKYL